MPSVVAQVMRRMSDVARSSGLYNKLNVKFRPGVVNQV